ncbi:MAG: hypothetical protein SFT90_04710 [Rickettsiales bacterium]|nr:hypothetical protein [Rickettsiales bacterium]
MKKLLTILFASAVITSCSVGKSDGVIKPGERTGGIFGLMKEDDLKVESKGAFEGTEEVVVASFKVGFVEKKTDSSQARGGLMGGGFGGKSSAKMDLTGVNDSIRQEIAEQAYKDFVAQLKAKGFKVSPSSEILKDKDFSETKTYDTPYVDNQGGLISTTNVTKYFQPKELGKIRFFLGDNINITGGFGFGNPTIVASNIAEKTKKKILSVTYIVDFSNAEGDSGVSYSTLQVGQGITVTPGSKLNLIGGNGSPFSPANGNITVGQPVYSTKEFGEVISTSSDAYKATETALNLASALMGGGTNQTRSFTVKANPSKYKAVSLEVLKDANSGIVGKMASIK